jgi:hypothetical protein
MKQLWGEWREMYARDFIDFLDGLIREGEAAG